MTEPDRLQAAAECGWAAAETLAMMERRRHEAAKLGIDLPALLAADFAARPPITSSKPLTIAPPERARPRLVFSRD